MVTSLARRIADGFDAHMLHHKCSHYDYDLAPDEGIQKAGSGLTAKRIWRHCPLFFELASAVCRKLIKHGVTANSFVAGGHKQPVANT